MHRELFTPLRALALSVLCFFLLDTSAGSPIISNIKGKSVDVIFPDGTQGFCLNMCDMIKDICNNPDKPVCRFVEKPSCVYRCEKPTAASSVTNILSGSALPLSSVDVMPLVQDVPRHRTRDRLGPRPIARRR